eukprot:5291866-Amphidinium_carterae.1
MAKTSAKGQGRQKEDCVMSRLRSWRRWVHEATHARTSMCARRTNAQSVDLAITDLRSAPGSRI